MCCRDPRRPWMRRVRSRAHLRPWRRSGLRCTPASPPLSNLCLMTKSNWSCSAGWPRSPRYATANVRVSVRVSVRLCMCRGFNMLHRLRGHVLVLVCKRVLPYLLSSACASSLRTADGGQGAHRNRAPGVPPGHCGTAEQQTAVRLAAACLAHTDSPAYRRTQGA